MNETNIQAKGYCRECGGFVEYDTSCVLTSNPPKYKGWCKDCNSVEYINTNEFILFCKQGFNKIDY